MKKKGFTLIELLAVIVILAIIALIAVPVITNIISDARKKAFENTAYGLISAGEMYYAEELLEKGMKEDVEFTITDGEFEGTNKLEIKGALPTSGKIKVTRDGKVALAIINGTMCITKGYDNSKIEIEENFEICYLPKVKNPYLSSSNSCVTDVNLKCTDNDSDIQNGIKVSVKVNEKETKEFYVIDDNGEELTLILSENIDDTKVAWLSQGDYITNGGEDLSNDGAGCQNAGWCVNNNKGPITALNYLESKTSEWTNVPLKTYTITDDATSSQYIVTRTNIRARLLTATEARLLGCTGSPNLGPTWLYGNVDTYTGYWLSTTPGNYYQAMILKGDGMFTSINSSDIASGIRPVIIIPKMI